MPMHASGRRPVFYCLAWKGHLSRVYKSLFMTRLASSLRDASAYAWQRITTRTLWLALTHGDA